MTPLEEAKRVHAAAEKAFGDARAAVRAAEGAERKAQQEYLRALAALTEVEVRQQIANSK
jgi:hypothetical protein